MYRTQTNVGIGWGNDPGTEWRQHGRRGVALGLGRRHGGGGIFVAAAATLGGVVLIVRRRTLLLLLGLESVDFFRRELNGGGLTAEKFLPAWRFCKITKERIRIKSWVKIGAINLHIPLVGEIV